MSLRFVGQAAGKFGAEFSLDSSAFPEAIGQPTDARVQSALDGRLGLSLSSLRAGWTVPRISRPVIQQTPLGSSLT